MKFKFFPALMLLALSVYSSGCKPAKFEMTVYDGFTQGTTFHIVVKESKEVNIKHTVDSIFEAVDKSMSLYDPNSLISRINRNETDSVDQYIKDCISIAEKLSIESEGLYDITIKPLTGAYGFAGDEVFTYGEGEGAPSIEFLLQFVGYEKISINGDRIIKQHPFVQIDLNSIAQGYTVDLIAKHFDALGYRNYIIEMGGEIFSRGTNRNNVPWVVGIDKPVEGNNAPGTNLQVKLNLSGKGLATSGNYRKFTIDESGRKIVHSVNAVTGEPVISNMLSATVVAPDATLADIYGTFFMVAGLEKSIETLKKHPELAAYIIYSGDNGEYKIFKTDNLEIKE